jgi:hypothetical protein
MLCILLSIPTLVQGGRFAIQSPMDRRVCDSVQHLDLWHPFIFKSLTILLYVSGPNRSTLARRLHDAQDGKMEAGLFTTMGCRKGKTPSMRLRHEV